jgi:hypothetical protein
MPNHKQIERCVTDIEWRFDNLYYIINKDGKKVVFKRNPSQMDLWLNRWYWNIILKDRQRGFSTLIAMIMADTVFWNKNQKCGIIDITLKDAMRKLGKIKYAYDNLPEDIKEKNPLITDSKQELVWKNGSSVYCGTSHRGDTLQILHISEFGKISARTPEQAREIVTGAINTLKIGQTLFIESTAEGKSGRFYEYCQKAQDMMLSKAKLTKQSFKFFFYGWWEDGNDNEMNPEGVTISKDNEKYFKNLERKVNITLSESKKAFYQIKSDTMKGDMCREYPGTPAEAFDASIEGAYLASKIKELRKKGQISRFVHDPASPVNTSWDVGLSDNMSIWLHQYVENQHRFIGYLSGTDEDIPFYWDVIQKLNYTLGNLFLPHDGETRRLGSAESATEKPKTMKIILENLGAQNVKIVPRTPSKIISIQETRLFLPQCFISTACESQPDWSKETADKYKGGITCLENYRREWDKKNGCWRDKPVSDWAGHGYDSFETFVRGWAAHGGIVGRKRTSDFSRIRLNTFVC